MRPILISKNLEDPIRNANFQVLRLGLFVVLLGLSTYTISYLRCHTVSYHMPEFLYCNTGTQACDIKPYHLYDNVDDEFVTFLKFNKKL